MGAGSPVIVVDSSIWIDGIIATACNCFAEACVYAANLPLLFSGRNFPLYVEHLGLEAA